MSLRIGFLGAGNMAHGMVRRLLESGHAVSIYNRTRSKALALRDLGAVVAASPREAATDADAVIAMVGDDEAARSVWLGEAGALGARAKPGAWAIDCSTLSIDWVNAFSRNARQHGWRPIDCPVTGQPANAARGELRLLVGADVSDLEAARPLLSLFAKDVVHFGAHGAGTQFKLILNLLGAVQIAGAAEALAMARATGLDMDKVLHVLSDGVASAPQVVRVAKNIVADDHEHNIIFSARWRLKDIRYGVELAQRLQSAVPLGAVARSLFDKVVAAGLGECNESVVVRAFDGEA
ncbi:NAD(P)-dependent oxidoreductase [Ramlibacter sp.]|uniref:NAD(P)-dependent oxidoreductase n=1 Tax=Ramlibacter sp. TaxID=1917967 RepID=UPI003D14A616